MRGGINKIQFQEQQFDSFLGINFTATTHEWTDVFVSTNGQNVVNLNDTTPGASAFIGVPTLKHFTQQVGRAIFQPDILFVADELGVSPDGIPIAFNRTDNTVWVDNYTNNLGPAQLLTTNVGPGSIGGPISTPSPSSVRALRSSGVAKPAWSATPTPTVFGATSRARVRMISWCFRMTLRCRFLKTPSRPQPRCR